MRPSLLVLIGVLCFVVIYTYREVSKRNHLMHNLEFTPFAECYGRCILFLLPVVFCIDPLRLLWPPRLFIKLNNYFHLQFILATSFLFIPYFCYRPIIFSFYRKPGVTGKGLYQLKNEIRPTCSQYFYHYNKTERAKVCCWENGFSKFGILFIRCIHINLVSLIWSVCILCILNSWE